MKKFNAGRFGAEVYGDGWPVPIVVWLDDKTEYRINHQEIRDLRYVLKRAMREAKRSLSGGNRLEI